MGIVGNGGKQVYDLLVEIGVPSKHANVFAHEIGQLQDLVAWLLKTERPWWALRARITGFGPARALALFQRLTELEYGVPPFPDNLRPPRPPVTITGITGQPVVLTYFQNRVYQELIRRPAIKYTAGDTARRLNLKRQLSPAVGRALRTLSHNPETGIQGDGDHYWYPVPEDRLSANLPDATGITELEAFIVKLQVATEQAGTQLELYRRLFQIINTAERSLQALSVDAAEHDVVLPQVTIFIETTRSE